MKKLFITLFVLCLIVSPFILTSCDKDHGTTKYEDVDDDDWKKRMYSLDENECIDLQSVEFYTGENNN